MSKLSCEKPYVINKWLKSSIKTYPKLCVSLQKVQMYSKFHVALPLYFCLWKRRLRVSIAHKEMGIFMCHPASHFLLQPVSCTHFFTSAQSLCDYVTDHSSPLKSNSSF